MSVPGNDGYSHDTKAIRDVANDVLTSTGAENGPSSDPPINEDIGKARDRFDATVSDASAAFRSGPSSGAFASLRDKWAEASGGISSGMATSRARVEDAAEALRKTADDYDRIDAQAAADFEGLLRSLRER